MNFVVTGGNMDQPFMKPKKAKAKKRSKPKAAKRPKPKAKKAAKRKTAKAKPAASVVRSERMDLRLTKAEKAKVLAKAKKTKRTITSLFVEALGKIK